MLDPKELSLISDKFKVANPNLLSKLEPHKYIIIVHEEVLAQLVVAITGIVVPIPTNIDTEMLHIFLNFILSFHPFVF
jgi:hypothetical protein